ncbi:M28 family metallopeptidase [Tautonia plasticadhaerens]|uniref:Bacterial leucyl aminopeptidase n=1 Tax=Tautonia plasticadhaerens TaxID=2527974 RepID=A0A518HCB1_9BACT|nr:M20/M25/M40 family metallo-hydrolase [Tautonia plasticadhaerens]QDV38505.1 Bacterial leucyl aminopeptidase precursor [Tautonia plasticadhaerens]
MTTATARIPFASVLLITTPVLAIADGPAPPAGRIAADVAALVGFGTRHSLSDQNDRAADWLAGRFRELGYDEVGFHEFAIGGRTRRNVIATIRGTSHADEVVLVGAHYDSRNRRIGDAEGPAPGAVDNASGTAALLELARSLAGDADRPGRTVRLIAFSGEEQGLVGSRAYANTAKEAGTTIALMINLDMIAHPMDEDGLAIVVERDSGLRDPENDEDSASWASRLESHVRDAGLIPSPGPLYGSDYMPFEAIGVPCVGLFDGADRAPFYHDEADTPDRVDPDYCAAATLATLSLIREAADPGFAPGRRGHEAP